MRSRYCLWVLRRAAQCALALTLACAKAPDDDRAASTKRANADDIEAAGTVDTVGVSNLAEADTLNLDPNLTIIETTRVFPPEAEGGEAVAWEFYAESHRPVKLLIFRWVGNSRTRFELVGESPLIVPRELGVNRVVLPAPIPVGFRYLTGSYQPEAGTVPFRKIRNWKTIITQGVYGRPFTERTDFVTYGWRYAYRVLWRHIGGST